jgi:transposase
MSTSLMFHALGVKGFQLQRTDFSSGEITFHLSQDPLNLRCPICRSSKVLRRGKRKRRIRSVPIGSKMTFISFQHQRVACLECNVIRYIKVNFVAKNKQHTRAFKNYALSLLRFSTIKDVANLLHVGWDLIKDIDKTDLKRFQKISLKNVKRIAIDEIYLGKKEKFVTIVLNIDTGAIIYVEKGKGAESLDPFWKKIKHSKANIEAVTSDMSPAYTKAILENIPSAIHVSDPFHVIKLFNEKLTALRRDLFNEVTDPLKKKSSKEADGCF